MYETPIWRVSLESRGQKISCNSQFKADTIEQSWPQEAAAEESLTSCVAPRSCVILSGWPQAAPRQIVNYCGGRPSPSHPPLSHHPHPPRYCFQAVKKETERAHNGPGKCLTIPHCFVGLGRKHFHSTFVTLSRKPYFLRKMFL